MKARSEGQRGTLSIQQRFAMGCVSGASAHAVFYPLEVSECICRSGLSWIVLRCLGLSLCWSIRCFGEVVDHFISKLSLYFW